MLQFPRKSSNVPQNGDPICKRRRTCEIAAAVPQIPARTAPATPLNFKTHLCANFRLGHCGYGSKCQFAHGIGEMRKPFQLPLPVPVIGNDFSAPNWNGYFGRVCRMHYMGKQCRYGDTCRFAHVNPERNGCGSSRPWVKRKLCNKWELTGSCHFGTMCLFAHGQAELARPDCHIALVSGSIQINTSQSVLRSKTGIWSSPNQQVKGGKLDSKPKPIQKLAGIYADWIEDKSFLGNLVKRSG